MDKDKRRGCLSEIVWTFVLSGATIAAGYISGAHGFQSGYEQALMDQKLKESQLRYMRIIDSQGAYKYDPMNRQRDSNVEIDESAK
ncbi:hypothetical protein HY492_01760 [Candidatus Woesearchaeota archaeon]|nr:hypothetical protein [Candidatus Woesearchaeota archaeon]